MKAIRIFIFAFLLFTISTVIQAQELITVNPQEYPKALKNPFKGFRPDQNTYPTVDKPYPTIVRDYITWREIENDSTDGVQKIIDFCNSNWKDFEKKNIKVIPRVYILWDEGDTKGGWPSDISYGDWSSPKFKDRVVKLIYKLGQAWDNDPRVAWVQTGIIGWWGEQENPVGVDEDGWAKRLGDAFAGAFKNKKILVRNQDVWETAGYKLGTYWDSYGHPSQSGVRTRIMDRNNQGRYLTEIIEGETAYNWGNDTWNPKYGASPTITCNNYLYTNNMIDAIKELHCSGLGWIASYKTDGSEASNIDTVKANAARIQEAFGYNFVIPEFSCSPRVNQGSAIKIKFKVKNNGSAPFYENWPLTLVLIDETTKNIVWKEQIKSVDIRKWYPGDKYSLTTKSYTTPAKEYTIDTTITIPTTITTGQYMVGISILEPYSQTPGVFFDIKNFLTTSQTQPLCRIGIGMDRTGSYEVSPTLFGDPLTNDTRSYTLVPKGTTSNLTVTPPTNGTITYLPTGGKYLPGTVATLTAKGNFGYRLKTWTGNKTGSTNPDTIFMDGNKTISAEFEAFETYELVKTATNGTISTSPTGTLFESGVSVTVTAVPNPGYKFIKWSGDLSGTSNPATLVMNAQKSITAEFEKMIMYDIIKNATNGTITTTPSGTTFETGTNISVKANPDFGYKFTGWSGDLSGTSNPAAIVLNANKNITANFAKDEGTIVFATNCGGKEYIASDGVKYAADTFFNGGTAYIVTKSIDSTDNPLFQSERWGANFGYDIPLQNGTYQVMLRFAEINYTVINKRIFNVSIEGTKVISDLDIVAKVSSNVYNETFLVNLTDGVMNISLSGVKENAKISAIKILKVSAVTRYNLNVSATNGTVELFPTGGNYSENSIVTLTPKPNTGYKFGGWSGSKSGSTNPDTIFMNGNKSVTATFSLIPVVEDTTSYTLNTSVTNGSISLNPSGGIYKKGTVVIITASPKNSDYIFSNWSGIKSGSKNPDTIRMTSNKSISAVFTQIADTLVNKLRNLSTNSFVLEQNYPNPFLTGTTIPYHITEAAHVRLSIHNCLGQQVAILVNEFQNVGKYSVYWNAQNCCGTQIENGMYLYRLEIGNKTSFSRKMYIFDEK